MRWFNQRRPWVWCGVGLTVLFLAIGLGYWQGKPAGIRLTIVREVMNNERPVVYFRFADTKNRSWAINHPQCFLAGGQRVSTHALGLPILTRGTWDFAVDAPTKTDVWRLAVDVSPGHGFASRVKDALSTLRWTRAQGATYADSFRMLKDNWGDEPLIAGGTNRLVSDYITNSVIRNPPLKRSPHNAQLIMLVALCAGLGSGRAAPVDLVLQCGHGAQVSRQPQAVLPHLRAVR